MTGKSILSGYYQKKKESRVMKDVSVIMPLFNAEKYLAEALQSVLSQTYGNFELICINDCSTDNTGKILTDFQHKDKRIRIIENTEHSGAGLSRNRGLKEAAGEYVIFLDGDDIFEEELLEKARDTLKKSNADIVYFEFLHTPSEEIYIKKRIERPEKFREDYCKVPFSLRSLDPREVAGWSGATCNKMYRRCFLIDNQIEFQNLASSNDIYFSKMALYCAKRIIWMDDRRVMVYVREHFESSRISNDRDPMCAYYALEKTARELRERNMMDDLAGFFYCTLVSDIFYTLDKEKNEERKREFYYFLQRKGIARCIGYGGEAYRNADSYDKYMLDHFLNNTYESCWFDPQDTYFQFYLKKNGQAVLDFIKEKAEQDKKIVLWGIGINGKILLDFLDAHSTRIFAITDMDRNKQGSTVNGYRIINPDDVWDMADFVITTSKQILWTIKNRTGHTGAAVIDVLEMIRNRRITDFSDSIVRMGDQKCRMYQ